MDRVLLGGAGSMGQKNYHLGEIMSMRRAWPGGICRLLGIVLLPLMGGAAPSPPAPSPPSTSLSPPSVSLGAGESTTIAIRADGLGAGDTAAQFGVVHNNAN